MPADHAAGTAAHVGHEGPPGRAGLAHAIHRLHAIELSPRRQLHTGVLPQAHGGTGFHCGTGFQPVILLDRGPPGRMGQAHEILVVEINRETLLAVNRFGVGVVSPQPHVQQPHLTLPDVLVIWTNLCSTGSLASNR